MNTGLNQLSIALEQAVKPEDVFGTVAGSCEAQKAAVAKAYRRLARIAHPDAYQEEDDRRMAQAVFVRLSSWYDAANLKLSAGVYGNHAPGAGKGRASTRPGRRILKLEATLTASFAYRYYRATVDNVSTQMPVIVKVPHSPADSDLAENEAQMLRVLRTGEQAHRFHPYFPELVDTVRLEEGSAVYTANVFRWESGWYSLEEVRKAYPEGIDAKDMVWIWRRLLVALGFAHRRGLVHGAVLPGNVAILPDDHGLMLNEWSFAVQNAQATGVTVTAIDPSYESWYPPEVLRRQIPLPGTDIGMAARCMIDLIGGDADKGILPCGAPPPLQSFFKGCLLPGRRARPQDAWVLLRAFDALIQQLWGKREFHPFSMQEPRR